MICRDDGHPAVDAMPVVALAGRTKVIIVFDKPIENRFLQRNIDAPLDRRLVGNRVDVGSFSNFLLPDLLKS